MTHVSQVPEKLPYTAAHMLINRKDRTSEQIFTLDIETTTFFYNETKRAKDFNTVISEPHKGITDAEYINNRYSKHAYCYIWMFSIGTDVYYGRYLHELPVFIYKLVNQYNMNIKIFVHNLPFEFQFIKHLFKWNTQAYHAIYNKTGIVARRMHKVQNIHTRCGRVQFVDTLVMAAVSLERLTDKFGLPISKLSGSLDYTKLRHSKTELTEQELLYCKYDCLVLYYYIKHELAISGTMPKLPKTQTGKTRKLVNAEYAERLKYRRQETARTAPDINAYIKLHRAFLGGYTHANFAHSGKVLTDIQSYDLKSWYPGVMVLNKFPTGKWQELPIDGGTLEYIQNFFDTQAFVMTVRFKDINILGFNTYISLSKCTVDGEIIVDNGRIIYADELTTTITEQDFLTIDENYTYTDIELIDCMYCAKEYIDIEVINTIIYLFEQKENIGRQLKSEPDNIELKVQYGGIKQLINSLYGMSVTNYISDIITLLPSMQWDKEIVDYNGIAKQLEKLTANMVLTTPYSWGVWITAYARRGLWEMINKINYDVIYCDTDSIKLQNYDKHKQLFDEFNENQRQKLQRVSTERSIDVTALKNIGTFEHDSFCKSRDGQTSVSYLEFKTLGAKKYCYRDFDGLHITVSGVSKHGAICLNNDINNFKSGFTFDYRANGKQVSYIDEPVSIKMIDHNGQFDTIKCNSAITIYPAVKKMTVGREYSELLNFRNSIDMDDDILDFVSDSGCLLLKTL